MSTVPIFQPEFNQMVAEIANKIHPPQAQNYFPSISTPLEIHAGIVITGTFETDDDSTYGRLSYVTVLRDSTSADPANGYGFAWMKGDGTLYNVYLVDNSSLANDLFVGPSVVVNPQGENSWKAAAKVIISPSTQSTSNVYNFELTINIDYSMSLKIWLTGQSKPTQPTVSCGAPKGLPTASGSNFGIGVLGTRNAQWWYGNILIQTSNGVHTAVLYRLKARSTDFPDGTQVKVQFYGYASDGMGSPNYGTSLFVQQTISGIATWVPAGTNTSSNVTNKNLTLIEYPFTMGSLYRTSDSFINVLSTSTYAATNVTQVNTYYTDLMTAMPSGVHTGGCADIYVNDPATVLVATNTVNNLTGNVALNTGNGFYGPVHSIVQVQTALAGNNLTVNNDWTLVSPNVALAYSIQENPYLTFGTALTNYKIQVIYRYWQNGNAVQTLLNSPTNRYSGASNLAKIMPPAVVTINVLNYRGTASLTTVQNAIIALINGTTTTLNLADIVSTVYAAGASFVDLSTLDVSVTLYDYQRIIYDPVPLVTSYTLPDLTAFFADATSLAGISKL